MSITVGKEIGVSERQHLVLGETKKGHITGVGGLCLAGDLSLFKSGDKSTASAGITVILPTL